MKLRPEDVVEITKESLKDLLKALQFNHADAGRICGLSPFAISRWRSSSHIPKAHLVRLGTELAKQLAGKSSDEFTPAQTRAKTFIETTVKTSLAVLAATGSAVPGSLSSALVGHRQTGGARSGSIQDLVAESDEVPNGSGKEKLLSDASVKELAQELESRGWRVSLSLKKK